MNETILSVCLGLGLAAACGFRVFVPLLVVNLAVRAGFVTLGASFGWLESTPALVAFALATAAEIGAYYIPWLDNLLDSAAAPAAVTAGTVLSASVITGMDPFFQWTLAAIAGGGVAGGVQVLTTGARGASTLLTGGLGNFAVASAELGGSLLFAVLSVMVPVVAVLLLIVLTLVAVNRLRRRRLEASPSP